MRIKQAADTLATKFHTRNPVELAEQLHILLFYEALGSIRGYYSRFYRQKSIHINSALAKREQQFVCAHELGHALLHPELNVLFLRRNTLLPVSRLEQEANRFAVNLLYEDEVFFALLPHSVEEISRILGLPSALVEYRLKLLCPDIGMGAER